MPEFVSRAGLKLEHALATFGVDVAGLVCADLGSNTGGFVDCLLQRGAARVYAVERGYGVLDWKLRKDPRVVVMERTNAMHVRLPEPAGFISIDVSWTRQRHILPAAKGLLATGGRAIAGSQESASTLTGGVCTHSPDSAGGGTGGATCGRPAAGGRVVTLIKPHYEADPKLLRKGVLPAEQVDVVVQAVLEEIRAAGFDVLGTTPSPIRGGQGNTEILAFLDYRG
ncbi:MAG: TlyA family RNA methyltransferase [Tepidisphaerales bacterium]